MFHPVSNADLSLMCHAHNSTFSFLLENNESHATKQALYTHVHTVHNKTHGN